MTVQDETWRITTTLWNIAFSSIVICDYVAVVQCTKVADDLIQEADQSLVWKEKKSELEKYTHMGLNFQILRKWRCKKGARTS